MHPNFSANIVIFYILLSPISKREKNTCFTVEIRIQLRPLLFCNPQVLETRERSVR